MNERQVMTHLVIKGFNVEQASDVVPWAINALTRLLKTSRVNEKDLVLPLGEMKESLAKARILTKHRYPTSLSAPGEEFYTSVLPLILWTQNRSKPPQKLT